MTSSSKGMQLGVSWKPAMTVVILIGATVMAGASNKGVIESVRAMEQMLGVTIAPPYRGLILSKPTTHRIPDTYVSCGTLAVAPDGEAIAWCFAPYPYNNEAIPLVTVKSLKNGEQAVWIDGLVAAGTIGISANGDVIVAIVRPLDPIHGQQRELLGIRWRNGINLKKLTPFVTQFRVDNNVESGNNIEVISVSGEGTLAALGTPQQIQVLEVTSGKTVFAGPGRFPRVSPDGARLAYVDKDQLLIHSFADGSTVHLVKGKRVKGLGGWSPDGRFLLAGAWTRPMWLAWEKHQIVVDTKTDNYGVIDKLGEGDYGDQFAWVSLKLLRNH